MIGGVGDAAKIPELRRRVLFTLGMLIIYRVGVFVPTPGVDAARFAELFERAASSLFGTINMFSGGALEQFSVFALGIMPYISVSIIIQVLTATSKHLEELQKEGEAGRRIITRYTRIGTIVLALFQGTFISIGLESLGVVSNPGMAFRIESAITLTAGTAFIMWLGEQITERGIGNGISLIIMAGIVARMPSTLLETFGLMAEGTMKPASLLAILLFALATVAFIVFVERCQRRLPVQYPRRAMGKRMTQATTQHLPLKVNSAGVIPPIFASALFGFLGMVTQFSNFEPLVQASRHFGPPSTIYYVSFALLNIFFCYFYTALVVDPDKIADNLKKNGGFIPTVRPGRDTAMFIGTVLNRLTFWGGLYICVVCIAPMIFYLEMGAQQFTWFFGGTAILIVVGVTLDTVSQMESHIVARNYDGFMSKNPGKMRGATGRAAAGRSRLIQR